MDPDATIDRMIEILNEGVDRQELNELCSALASWLNKGGFHPTRPNWKSVYARAVRATS